MVLRLRVLRFLGWSSLLHVLCQAASFGRRSCVFNKSKDRDPDVSLTQTVAALAFMSDPSERALPISNEPVRRRRIPFRRGLSPIRRSQGKPELL